MNSKSDNNPNNKLPDFRGWTLFLDRDGVINTRIPGRYVTDWDQFEFRIEVLESIPILRQIFSRIIVVTNQAGVAKGILSAEELDNLHRRMCREVESCDGKFDSVYYAPQAVEEKHIDRKPGPGMALKAKQDFPDIKFTRSVMVGDSMSDMVFGKRLGMFTIHMSGKEEEIEMIDSNFIDMRINAFAEIAQLNQSLKS